MPGLDGFDTSRELTLLFQQGLLSKIPIIALTANVMRGDRERCLQAGMVDYASKPLRKEQLSKLLLKWLPEQYIATVETEVSILKDLSVMLVEDNRINMEFAREILERAGCNVLAAHNGIEAIIEAKRDQPYDIIFMDIQMPEMDGFEATRRLRELQHKRIIPERPIIALTANAMVGDKEACLAAGMSDYLSKPLQGEQLLSMIRKWVPLQAISSNERRRHRNAQEHLLQFDMIEEARGVLGKEFSMMLMLYVDTVEFVLEEMRRAICAKRDPYGLFMNAHSLKSSSAYIGAQRMTRLMADLENVSMHASTTHGDITKLWPIFEEIRFAWGQTKPLLLAEAARPDCVLRTA